MRVNVVAVLLPLLCALVVSFSVGYAAEITACRLDKSAYYPGGSGYVNVTVYNDKGDVIRVTEVSATVNYFYADGTQYTQTNSTSSQTTKNSTTQYYSRSQQQTENSSAHQHHGTQTAYSGKYGTTQHTTTTQKATQPTNKH